jgi:hypothetical protein
MPAPPNIGCARKLDWLITAKQVVYTAEPSVAGPPSGSCVLSFKVVAGLPGEDTGTYNGLPSLGGPAVVSEGRASTAEGPQYRIVIEIRVLDRDINDSLDTKVVTSRDAARVARCA